MYEINIGYCAKGYYMVKMCIIENYKRYEISYRTTYFAFYFAYNTWLT